MSFHPGQMSSQALPPPPPSPSSSTFSQQQQQQQQQQQRRQPVPPPALTTALGQQHRSLLAASAASVPTPSSTVHAHSTSPYTPSVPSSAASSLTSPVVPRVSPSNPAAMTSYNPQEWSRSGSVAGQYVPHAASIAQARARGTRDATGMEASLPSPPPPYSASASPNVGSSRTFQAATPLANATPPEQNPQPASSSMARSTPQPDVTSPATTTSPTPAMNFPPPPGSQRDRSGSRTRGVLNNIAAFASSRTRQNETASPANATDVTPRQRSESITRPGAGQFRATYNPTNPAVAQPGPPAARRSASAGVGPPTYDQARDNQREGSWDQSRPLPGPPPGPPPSSRSQSMNRALDRSIDSSHDPSAIHAPIPTRVARGSNLGPVPPTPADWVDEDAATTASAQQSSQHPLPAPAPATQPSSSSERAPLRLDTQTGSSNWQPSDAAATSIQSAIEPGVRFGNSTREGFAQIQPRREPSMSIRDRRNETRARSREPQSAIENHNNIIWANNSSEETKPANLVLSTSNNSGLGRRRHVQKAAASPRSAHFSPKPSSAGQSESQHATPNTLDSTSRSATMPLPGVAANQTPPFSPESGQRDKDMGIRPLLTNTPKGLPTPNSARSGKQASEQMEESPQTGGPNSAVWTSTKLDDFAQASIERFQKFLMCEMAATDDVEKLELFAQFAVHESRLRRDRYSKAFESLGSDVLDLTRDLWRSLENPKRPKAATPAATPGTTPGVPPESQRVTPRPSSRSETDTPIEPSSASSPASAAYTPVTEPESPGINSMQGRGMRVDGQRQNSFQPILSPIPSMAMSTAPDDSDSRGRSASRWFEASEEGSIAAGGGRRIERTKRESKYMGLPREAREHLQWEAAEPSPSYNLAGPSNQYQHLGPNEYPPEKVGWHEESTPSRTGGFAQTPSTPQPRGLDVSRLITLPPPYPRHHPAVNNNHPELATIRATLYALNDIEEPANFFDQYEALHPAQPADFDNHAASERRREMHAQIQSHVASGSMSFAEAARAETEFEEAEGKRAQELAKKRFDDFQALVLKPLSAVYNARITQATASIDNLRANLQDTTANLNPNQTQEEGDEQPETLEKLTLMKWFFEAREKLHKDAFDLQAQSDDKYKHVILASYRQASNGTKIKEVQSFFVKDARDRLLNFSTQVLQRFEAFQATVDHIVTAYVETQLSAFWDIAPGLLAIVQKVPETERALHTFELLIPPPELDENPSFAEFPLQYLYTLLLHAEKSAYQFIEAQTNMLCLLHEVRSGVMLAHAKVLEDQRTREGFLARENGAADGESEDDVRSEMQGVREAEDQRLTAELKEKVDVVEEQWRSALGSALAACKRRVAGFLERVGGWDDALVE